MKPLMVKELIFLFLNILEKRPLNDDVKSLPKKRRVNRLKNVSENISTSKRKKSKMNLSVDEKGPKIEERKKKGKDVWPEAVEVLIKKRKKVRIKTIIILWIVFYYKNLLCLCQ
jgi:hypothetical protein